MNEIVVVAPYSPIGTPSPNLGGSNKIASVVRILSTYGPRIVFINTAHNDCRIAPAASTRATIGGCKLVNVTPFTLWSRPIGKCLNLLATNQLARRIARLKPSLVWIYNGYAFESKIAIELQVLTDCPIVLELEDWVTARSRGLNPKPLIDAFYFRRAIPKAVLVTLVNQHVGSQLGLAASKTMLLPGIISPLLVQSISGRPRFSRRPFTLGYFGRLDSEKGADVILELSRRLPGDWNVAVTGSGELATSFREIAAQSADRITFIENASSGDLYRTMCSCDVIVNPHKSIKAMGDGVFPFKVMEAIASGCLVISTELPECGLHLSDAVMFFEGGVKALMESLKRAETFYADKNRSINLLASQVTAAYGELAISETLQARLSNVHTPA